MISEASPQQSLSLPDTIPATETQLMSAVGGSSPGSGGDQSNCSPSPTSPVPSQASSSKGPTDEVPLAEFAFVCYLPFEDIPQKIHWFSNTSALTYILYDISIYKSRS